MSLFIAKSLGSKDRPIAVIRGGELNNQFLCISEKAGDEALVIPKESRFTFVPEYRDRVAQHIHVVGPSGCGKSTTCQEFADHFPGRVAVISADPEEDPELKRVDVRMKADENLQDVDLEKLRHDDGILVIFDDIEGVPKEISKSLNLFKRALHERGRKFGIRTLNVYHRGADGESTRSSLGEMTHMVLFPKFANNQNTRYLINKYAGLPENFCDLLQNPHWGRRVLIAINDTPQYIIGEHAAAVLNHSTISALAKYHRKKDALKIKEAMEQLQ